jgi:hypothetical protein
LEQFNEKELKKYNKTENSIEELLVNLDLKRKNTLISSYSDNGEMILSEQTSFVDKLFKWKKHNTIICICYNQYLLDYIKKKLDNDCVLYYINERLVEY